MNGEAGAGAAERVRAGADTLHVVFKVGGPHYVLPAKDVLHIEAFEGATAVPGAPPWVVGIVQVRRRVIPVVDLRARFGLPEVERTLGARVVVVQDGARVVGLLADGAREVVHLPADAFRPPPEMIAEQARGFVKAVAEIGKRLVMLLDVHRVVGTDIPGAASPGAIEDGQDGE